MPIILQYECLRPITKFLSEKSKTREYFKGGETLMQRLFIYGFSAMMVAGASFAFADSPKQDKKPEAGKSAGVEAGMKAYVDPETGQLTSRPTTQVDAGALDAQFKVDLSKIQEVKKADGSTEWLFNGQADSALIATRGADGKIGIVCAEHGVMHDHFVAPTTTGARDDH